MRWPIDSGAARPLTLGAPVAAVLLGAGAEWLDFRELRAAFLALGVAGVTVTALALRPGAWRAMPALRAALLTVALGAATWAAAEATYVALHLAQGERFHAERFGPQPAQAIGLIAAHALFLGVPTGVAAAALVFGREWLRRGARPADEAA
ncbi:MAG TPA: hypothetical protein VFC53_13745 [Dehalococcoidia bacterium]|nr:hypothetical protein [Dehalococcoidia bacterium]